MADDHPEWKTTEPLALVLSGDVKALAAQDQQMLQWTAAGEGKRFMGIVHHTDADREYAYDRDSHLGTLNKAWDEATERSWTVVDMARDWKTIYPE